MKKFLTRLLSAIMCLLVVAGNMVFYAPQTCAAGESLSSLKAKQTEIQKKIDESKKKLKELESQKASELQIVDELNKQLSTISDQCENIQAQKVKVTAEIRTTESKIATYSKEINVLGDNVNKKDEEIQKTVQLFCKRMRANYVSGGSTTFELFAKSNSVSSFLNRAELIKRVTEVDQNLVDTLDAEIKSIEEVKKKYEEKKTALETEKKNLEDKKSELQKTEQKLSATEAEIKTQSAVVNKKIKDLNLAHSAEESSAQGLTDDMKSVDDQIKAIIQNAQKTTTTTKKNSTTTTTKKNNSGKKEENTTNPKKKNTSEWIWPVPYDESYITSSYGYRSDPISGYTKYHSGIDISMSGAYGKNIVAVRSGTVIYTGFMSGGYGNYIIIDHGNGYQSLYGHCSQLIASYGQHVDQGDVIALIGSTGYSTGPHVHFEIRYYGEKVNPLNYVSH
ncbi:MAG: peptidoglycan DD-metalloendopeptidase family protein [Ruminococcus sp.]|nr:peptidoglycan DD-metalloendopeptidase family protein [Candidatus Copronaster equi]